MIDDEEKLRWGCDERVLVGSITRKRIGKGGQYEVFTNRHGEVHKIVPRDRHITITVTANVTKCVKETDAPGIGDVFIAPVDGVDTAFACTQSEMDIPKEDVAVVTMSGRTLPGLTPSAHLLETA